MDSLVLFFLKDECAITLIEILWFYPSTVLLDRARVFDIYTLEI